jgi:hypothetical protein
MLKQIKNIEGVTSLSKKKQQGLIAGIGFEVFTCVGNIMFNASLECPSSHPTPHPTHGACICCSGYWRKD